MKVYVDDQRDPDKHLPHNEADGIVLLRCPRQALRCFNEHRHEITDIHLDYYLNDRSINGGDVLRRIHLEVHGTRKPWPKLKNIYLHTSELSIIQRLMDEMESSFSQCGITLINNCQRN